MCWGRSKLNLLSLTFSLVNPKIWTKYDGVDPETSLAGPANAQGMDYFNSPGTKKWWCPARPYGLGGVAITTKI